MNGTVFKVKAFDFSNWTEDEMFELTKELAREKRLARQLEKDQFASGNIDRVSIDGTKS